MSKIAIRFDKDDRVTSSQKHKIYSNESSNKNSSRIEIQISEQGRDEFKKSDERVTDQQNALTLVQFYLYSLFILHTFQLKFNIFITIKNLFLN